MDGANEEEFIMQQQEPQQRARPPENHAEAHNPHHHQHQHHHPPPPPPRCPRCDSSNTKFCYYNNYSLSQPRYFCKACRRYWTQGGTLRNVPVGGGCRKSKRPRLHGSPSPSLSNGLILRAQGLSTAAAQPTAIASRSAPPPVAPPLGGSFYGGGSFLSSLATMQSSPAGGINQGAAMLGGGGGSHFGSNMALLQGMTFPSLNTPAPSHQHTSPSSTRFFPPQQSLIPPGRFSPWTQSVINAGGATSSSAAPPSGLWSSNGGAGSSEAGSSFTPNQWSDCNPGFKPSDQ